MPLASSDTLRELRRAQAPFTVGSFGQAAAIASLRHPERIWARQRGKRGGRDCGLPRSLLAREIEFVPSQTNFIFMLAPHGAATAEVLLRAGVIVRPFKDWIRVTIGTAEENDRFLRILDGLG